MVSQQALLSAQSILASAARTASVNSTDFVTSGATGLVVVIDVTAITATPSIVPTIQMKDVLSGKYVDVLTGAAITAVGTTVLYVDPRVAAVANVAANRPLGRLMRVVMTAADADSATYSVGGTLTD